MRQTYPWLWLAKPHTPNRVTSDLALELVESLPLVYKFLVLLPPIVFAIWFVIQRDWVNYTIKINSPVIRSIYAFFQNRAFFENIYYYFLVRPVLNYIYFILLVELERFALESLTVGTPVTFVTKLSRIINLSHASSILAYLGSFAISFFIILDFCFYFAN